MANDVSLLKEESERLGGEVLRLQERERTVRREALARHVEESEKPVVPEGPYSDMDPLDLGLLRRLARSQRRESYGPAWVQRTEEAKRALAESVTPAGVQDSGLAAARRLKDWYSVDSRPTGQFESFGRSVLQSMTRAAMDSTTAGSGDELVATLEARELWMDVNLQTLVAPLVHTLRHAVESLRSSAATRRRRFLSGKRRTSPQRPRPRARERPRWPRTSWSARPPTLSRLKRGRGDRDAAGDPGRPCAERGRGVGRHRAKR